MGLYNAKVLSTPSPKDIFLTVNEEFISLFFFAMQTPSTETAKKVEKKTETPKAESPKENLKEKK